MGESPRTVSPARPIRDLLLLYVTAFLRALSTGLIGVLLGIYLAKLGFDAAQIGYVIGAGLAGGACATLLVTLAGDRFGRKRALGCIALFGAVGGLAAAAASTFSTILAAAFLPEERTVASGVTHLVRVGAWAVAPPFAGALMQGVSLGIPIMIGAGMEITSDLLLYVAFRKAKPPEETVKAGKI